MSHGLATTIFEAQVDMIQIWDHNTQLYEGPRKTENNIHEYSLFTQELLMGHNNEYKLCLLVNNLLDIIVLFLVKTNNCVLVWGNRVLISK